MIYSAHLPSKSDKIFMSKGPKYTEICQAIRAYVYLNHECSFFFALVAFKLSLDVIQC